VDGPSGVSGEVGLGDTSSARTKRRHCRRWKAGIKSFAGFSYEFTTEANYYRIWASCQRWYGREIAGGLYVQLVRFDSGRGRRMRF
jgi:hypothetical protein